MDREKYFSEENDQTPAVTVSDSFVLDPEPSFQRTGSELI